MEAHIINLYDIIMSDGEAHPRELELLYAIAERQDIDRERVEFLIHHPHLALTKPVEDFEQLCMRLFDYAQVVCVDHKIRTVELRVLKQILRDLGVKEEETINEYMRFAVDYFLNCSKNPNCNLGVADFMAKLCASNMMNQSALEVVISQDGDLRVMPGPIQIDMPILEKTIYFFFLIYPRRIRIKDMVDHLDVLATIYGILKPGRDPLLARKSLESQWVDNGIHEKLSKIKRIMLNQLVKFKELEMLLIRGDRGGDFGVEVPKQLIHIEHPKLRVLNAAF